MCPYSVQYTYRNVYGKHTNENIFNIVYVTVLTGATLVGQLLSFPAWNCINVNVAQEIRIYQLLFYSNSI